jgi:hypothetical protein
VPASTRRRDVSAPLFVGVYRFFLTVRPRRPMVRHSVLSAAVVGKADRNSTSVASGVAVINAMSRCSWSALSVRRRNFVCCRGAVSPVSRRRCFNRSTHARLTEYFEATSLDAIPPSESPNTRVRKSIEYAAIAPPAGEVP